MILIQDSWFWGRNWMGMGETLPWPPPSSPWRQSTSLRNRVVTGGGGAKPRHSEFVCVCVFWIVVELSGPHAWRALSQGQGSLPWSLVGEGLFCLLVTAQPHPRGSFPGHLD